MKIVEPVGILKKSPNRKPDGNEGYFSDENPWITVDRGITTFQEEFKDLNNKLSCVAPLRVSFLDEKSARNTGTLEYYQSSKSTKCPNYLDRNTASKFSSDILAAPELNGACELNSNIILEQTNQKRTLRFDSILEEAEGSSSDEETEPLPNSEFMSDADCITETILSSRQRYNLSSNLDSVREEPVSNSDASHEVIGETDSSSFVNPSQSSSSIKSSFSDEATQLFDESNAEIDGLREPDLSGTVSSIEESFSGLQLSECASDSGNILLTLTYYCYSI